MLQKIRESKIYQLIRNRLTPTQLIAGSFIGVILIGSLLLSLPISNNGAIAPYLDNLFTAVSATCVTGLVTMTTADQFSVFGQIVIMVMIQIGGLGFITFFSLVLIRMQKTLSLGNKIVAQEALNQSSLTKLPDYLKKVVWFTFTIEGIGMLLFSLVFVPEFGVVRGLYYSLFHSVSAFCNAGFDLLGSNSLINYNTNLLVTITVSFLVIVGGIGFIFWYDLTEKWPLEKEKSRYNRLKFSWKRLFHSLTLGSKLALIMTGTLLMLGFGLFFLMEYHNSLQAFGFLDKLQVSFFQSMTTRTAGFASVDMGSLNTSTKMMMCIFMLIGGSPAGTAGGVKTVTMAIVILLVINIYLGRNELQVFNRRLKKRLIIRALAVFMIALTISVIAIIILSGSESGKLENIIFEVFSAIGTVGLTAGLTPSLTAVGKVVIMILMYIGRIGPISLIISFATKSNLNKSNNLVYPDEDVLIG